MWQTLLGRRDALSGLLQPSLGCDPRAELVAGQTDLIPSTSAGSLAPHIARRKITPQSSSLQLSLKQTLLMPQFPKGFLPPSPEVSDSRTVRKVLSDYYCIISGKCYKYPGAPLDTTQLPRGAGSALLCACTG